MTQFPLDRLCLSTLIVMVDLHLLCLLTCPSVCRKCSLLTREGLVAIETMTRTTTRTTGSNRPNLRLASVRDSTLLVKARGTSIHAYCVVQWWRPCNSRILNMTRYMVSMTSINVQIMERTKARSTVLMRIWLPRTLCMEQT